MEIKHFKTYQEYLQYYTLFKPSRTIISSDETNLSLKLIYKISDTQEIIIDMDYQQIKFQCLKSVKFGLKVNNKHDIRFVTHRLDGPAIITKSGTNIWVFNDKVVGDEFFIWAKNHNIDLDNYLTISDSDKLLIKLTWANYEQFHK